MPIRIIKNKFMPVFIVLLFSMGFSHTHGDWQYDSSLTTDVIFWKSVFTEYRNNQFIIHDAEKLDLIYKIITFDTSFSDYQIEKHLEKLKDDLTELLEEIAQHPEKMEEQGSLSKIISQHFGKNPDPSELKKAAKRLRAQQGMREPFEKGLSRSLLYIPYMQEIFKQFDLPEELAYLPHIESSFNPLARSKVGAAGMWQFMRSTGRRYMKINRVIDERYDPFISTRAAARLLKHNYEKLGDWGLAITAYNFGVNGMRKAAEIHGSDYVKVRESFNNRRFKFASRNFYPEFLAVIEIMKDYKQYFPDVKIQESPPIARYQLKRSIKFNQLAQFINIDLQEFKKFNPAYSSRVMKGQYPIPAKYWVNIPIESDLVKLEMKISDYAIEESKNIKESLKPVETNFNLSESSKQNSKEKKSLDNSQILSLFNERKPGVITDKLSTDQHLINWYQLFPPASSNTKLVMEQFNLEILPHMKIEGNYITVFGNETLGHYADWLRISLYHLQKINNLGQRRTIYQGRRLKMDFSRVSKEDFLNYRIRHHQRALSAFLNEKEVVSFIEYQIRSGESIWDIARIRYEVPLELIQYFNIKDDINKLYPGDIIRIPIFRSNIKLEETL
jgi:membrane-bound lytic murein transglycosylase D